MRDAMLEKREKSMGGQHDIQEKLVETTLGCRTELLGSGRNTTTGHEWSDAKFCRSCLCCRITSAGFSAPKSA